MRSQMCNLIEYLKAPELVVAVQEFFGIRYHRAKTQLSHGSTDASHKGDFISSRGALESQNQLHKRTHSDESNSSVVSGSSEDSSSAIKDDGDRCEVKNRFWYYLFIVGTALGDEIFYATFIPFWFWNIDGAVGRRVVFVWSSVMYVGQGFKDIIRWPRPGFPVTRLQKKWALEYGMPSTHAMVAVSIPFSVLIYTMDRYQYPVIVGVTIAILWCTLICVSRIYLGMHSILDIIAGLVLTFVLMVPLIPLVDYLDRLILESVYSPIFIFGISIALIIFYPDSGRWTPTRGDTTLTVSVTAGIQIGAWITYQMGNMVPPALPPPYEIIWPSYTQLGCIMLRTVLGMCCVMATRAIGKSVSYGFVCALLGRDKNELRNSENSLQNKHKIIVELSYKYFTYGMIGLITQYIVPNVFKLLEIGRPDFYTEF